MVTATRAAMQAVNPATGKVIGRFSYFSAEKVERMLDGAHRAFRKWRQVPFDDRARLTHAAATYLQSNRDRLARMLTEEMGKPIVQSEAEIAKAALICDYFADHAAGFLADQPHPSPAAAESYVVFDPLGVVLGAMPWNFPFAQTFRFAIPALMAGNTVLLKPSSNVPGSAIAFEEVFEASGFPAGAFGTLLISGETTDRLVADGRIAAVSVTGSVETGVKVGQAAGAALKKVVLELGGSDPFVVLEDADLDAAARAGVRSRHEKNSGQSCDSAKRFIVVDAVYDAFLDLFTRQVASLRVGDPLDRSTQVGPLVRGDIRDALDRQVRDSVRQGAKIVVGGHPIAGPGFFYAPTVLTDVTPTMAVFREETFGPVAALVRVRDADEAIRLANQTQFGLGADLWTRDLERAKRLARDIEAGQVFINDVVSSNPALPFGGVKHSGYGRELSEFGIREFTNVKTVWIGTDGAGGGSHNVSE